MLKRGVFCASAALLFTFVFSIGALCQPKSPAADHFNKALGLHKSGKIDAAIVEYKQAIAADPKLQPALLNLSSIYLAKNSPDAALPLLIKLSGLNPKNTQVLSEISRIYFSKNQLSKAEEYARKAVKIDPRNSAAIFTLGIIAVKEEDYNGAAAQFKKFVALNPNDLAARRNLAWCYLKLKDYSQALSQYNRILAASPSDMDTRRVAADLAARLGKSDEVIKHLIIIRKADPKDSMALLGLAEAYEHKALLSKDAKTKTTYQEKAVKYWNGLLAVDGKNFTASTALGRYAYEKGDFASAKKYFYNACMSAPQNAGAKYNLALAETQLKDFATAEKHYKAALDIDPKSSFIAVALGELFEQQGKFEDAVKYLRIAADQNPKDESLPIRIASDYSVAKKYPEAEREYQAILKKNPKNQMAMSALARMYRDRKDYDKAIELYQRMSAEMPKGATESSEFSSPEGQIINIMIEEKKFDEAAAECFKILEKNPKDETAFQCLDQIADQVNDPDKAAGYWQKLIALDPKNPEPRKRMADYYVRQKNIDLAIAQFEEILKVNPKDATSIDCIGNLLSRQGKKEEAIAKYREAAAIDPKNIQPHILTANAFESMGKMDEAQAELEKTCEANPKNSAAYEALAGFFEKRLKPDEAVKVYEKILTFDSKNPDALRSLIELNRRAERYDKAIEYQKELSASHPQYTSPADLGKLLATAGKTDEAIEEYKKQISQNSPGAALIRMELGAMLLEKQRLDEALAVYTEASKDPQTKADALAAMADIHVKQGKADQAADELKQVLKLQPSNGTALNQLSRIYKDKNQEKEWLEFLNETVKNSSQIPLYSFLMTEYKSVNKVNEGIAFLETLLPERDKDRGLNLTLVYWLQEVGEHQKAIDLCKKLIDADPNGNCDVHSVLGDIYESQNKPEDAASEYKAFLEKFDNPVYQMKYAALLEKCGKTAEALDKYKKIKKTDPANEKATEAIKRLEPQSKTAGQ
ncbi:MAG: tetratricopeptide repeat protein [Armatimonadota bacterium]